MAILTFSMTSQAPPSNPPLCPLTCYSILISLLPKGIYMSSMAESTS